MKMTRSQNMGWLRSKLEEVAAMYDDRGVSKKIDEVIYLVESMYAHDTAVRGHARRRRESAYNATHRPRILDEDLAVQLQPGEDNDE